MNNNNISQNKVHFLVSQLLKGQKQLISSGTHPVYIAYLIHCLNKQGPHIVVSQQSEQLTAIHQSLSFFEPYQEFFYLTDKEPLQKSFKNSQINLSNQSQAQRMRWLFKAQTARNTDVFLTNPQSLTKSTISPAAFKQHSIYLKTGQIIKKDLPRQLNNLSYRSCDRVELMGDFSLRGAVLDIFSPSSGPIRIELIGDEIVQIKTFNPITQRSLKQLQNISITPITESLGRNKAHPFPKNKPFPGLPETKKVTQHSLKTTYISLDHFHNTPCLWNLDNLAFLQKPFLHKYQENIREICFKSILSSQSYIDLPYSLPSKTFFKQSSWPEKIKTTRKNEFFVFIATHQEKQREKIKQILETVHLTVKPETFWGEMKSHQTEDPNTVHLISRFLPDNIILQKEKTCFLKADKLFQSQPKSYFTNSSEASSLNFAELDSQDLIVHKQHGIGRFQELKLIDFGTGENEFLVIEYRDNDKLYVPVYSIHQVQKYIGSYSKEFLDKLGDKKWLNTKQRVKSNLKDMTLQLMHLYSLRSQLRRKPFSTPSEDFEKFENEFPFEETKDQQTAITETLNDLTKTDQPTDRLICGDVGFGKTEIAMRAAFKIIEDGFQACLLAPTTILSFQHFQSFKTRFQNWPFHIQLLNRFTPLSERTKIINAAKSGSLDVLIGTHRILTRDIQFKNLGMLIIDEEHLFGVKSKEQFKHWKSSVDTLSLSATPIPRSLSISLSGLRPISVVNTPPLNRKSIKTYVNLFNAELIKEAISKELSRQGQVIFIHNRISDIHRIEKLLKKWLPSARIRIAHGQLKELQKKIVLDFFHHKFDILLCTTIVESGMDFSLAGTLFINDADEFGLSQLHQLRGRIGRSERQAYCYLLLKAGKKIKDTALKRLQIVQENNQPGAGLVIARHDLQMRGAGDLMGAEQSGFLQDLGFEMYFELLQENLQALKEPSKLLAPEPDLSFKTPAFLPKNYIPHEKARLMFYKKLSFADTNEDIEKLKEEIKDFGGPLPEAAENLIMLTRCRCLAKKLHIRELSYRKPFLCINFSNTTPITVQKALQWVEQGLCEWKTKDTLRFYIEKEDFSSVLKILQQLNVSSKEIISSS